MNVRVTVDPVGRQFVVDAAGITKNLLGLNKVLAGRLAEELVEYLRRENTRKPNRMGAPRTNFYSQVADSTAIAEVTDEGATVSIADSRFAIHVHGGEIKPVKAKMLTIPLVKEAHGLRASSYVKKYGRKLFTIPGKMALFEATEDGGKAGVRPVYALALSVKIPKDPTALPSDLTLAKMLQQEAQDWVDRQIRQPGGGLA